MGEAKQEEAKAETKPEEKEEKKEEKQEEKKEEKTEEKKEEAKPSPPPPIVLFVDLHCIGCAKKIERSILKCKGVEEVEVDMVHNQVTVKGIVDPQSLCSRIQKKTLRKAKVISPLPPADGDTTKPEAVVASQVSGVATVELNVNMHCEACAQQLRRKIMKMKGVQAVETELSNRKITVTGTMNADRLVEYIHRRTGKLAKVIPPPPPPPPPKEEEKKEEAEKKPEEKPPEEKIEEKKEETKEEEKAPVEQGKADSKEEKGGGEEQKKEGEGQHANNIIMISEEEMAKKMAYMYGGLMHEEEMARRMVQYVPIYMMERPMQPPPPPQLFSDENPNACCIS